MASYIIPSYNIPSYILHLISCVKIRILEYVDESIVVRQGTSCYLGLCYVILFLCYVILYCIVLCCTSVIVCFAWHFLFLFFLEGLRSDWVDLYFPLGVFSLFIPSSLYPYPYDFEIWVELMYLVFSFDLPPFDSIRSGLPLQRWNTLTIPTPTHTRIHIYNSPRASPSQTYQSLNTGTMTYS